MDINNVLKEIKIEDEKKKLYEELEESVYSSIGNTISKFLPTRMGDDEPTKRLTTISGRKWTREGEARTVTTRKQRKDLLKAGDLDAVKSVMSGSFKAIIAAATKTGIGNEVVAKLNMAKTQIEKAIQRKKKQTK